MNTDQARATPFQIYLHHRLHYLEVVAVLVKRELKVKYRGSVLGYLWSMLNPLLFMTIITVVFSFLVRGIENYNLYVLSGILFWNMVTLSLNMGTGSIVRNNSLIQKVKIPIWIFPIVPAGLGVANFLLSLIPYFVVYSFSGRAWPSQLWLAPVVFALTLVFLSSLSLALASLNVFFRDIAHVLEPLLTLLFYGTPIIFDRHGHNISEQVSNLLLLNPLTHFVEAFRATMFGGTVIGQREIFTLCLFSLSSLAIGLTVYKASKKNMIFHL